MSDPIDLTPATIAAIGESVARAMQEPPDLDGLIVEIDGKQHRLTARIDVNALRKRVVPREYDAALYDEPEPEPTTAVPTAELDALRECADALRFAAQRPYQNCMDRADAALARLDEATR